MLKPDPSPKEWAKLRKLRGLTQQEVAEEIGCNFTLISKYERGERIPSPELRDALLRLYHQNPDEFAPKVTLERLENKELIDRLTQLLRKNTDENRKEAYAVVDKLEKSSSLASVEGTQFLFRSKAALAGHEGDYERMHDLALKGLKISRPDNSSTGIMPFEEDKIGTYNLTIEEIKLINQLAVARYNMKVSAGDAKSSLEKSVGILSDLRNSVKASLHTSSNTDLINIYITIMYNLSTQLGLSKRYDEAILFCDEGVVYCKKFRNSHFVPMFMFNKSCALLYLGKKEDGVPILQKTYAIFAATDRRAELSRCMKFIEMKFGIKINTFNLHIPEEE